MEKETEKVEAIPERYRNRLFDWEGGGYDGCIWEPNQGIVTGDGHWRPLYSSGFDGLDVDTWYKGRRRDLAESLGYMANPDAEHFSIRYRAMDKVFGRGDARQRDYQPGWPDSDPGFAREVAEEEARYAEWRRKRAELDAGRQAMLDDLFMQVVSGELKRDAFREVGRIDKEHIRETCRIFCQDYASNAGMVANALDRMAEAGYDPWCTCTDCGEQFQTWNESYGACLDQDAYRGDGGVGIVLGRILCDECRDASTCPACQGASCPNPYAEDGGKGVWNGMSFLQAFLYKWLGVCGDCAECYGNRYLDRWDDDSRIWVRTDLGRRFDSVVGEDPGTSGAYDEMEGTPEGRSRIDAARDLLSESIRERFVDMMDEERLDSLLKLRMGPGDAKGK